MQKNGKEQTLWLWDENNTFGDVTSYFTENPPGKSYELVEDSIFYKINSTFFRGLFTRSSKISAPGRLLVEQYIVGQETLSRLYLGKNARERFEIFLNEKPGLINRVKSKYIASYLGLRPEIYTRMHSLWLKELSAKTR